MPYLEVDCKVPREFGRRPVQVEEHANRPVPEVFVCMRAFLGHMCA